jgi:hypothetical protein
MATFITLITYIAGIAACLMYLRQAPGPLRIAAAALAGLLAITLFESAVVPIIYRTLGPQRQGGLLVHNALAVMGFFGSVIRAAAIGGLVWAVLTERKIDFHRVG